MSDNRQQKYETDSSWLKSVDKDGRAYTEVKSNANGSYAIVSTQAGQTMVQVLNSGEVQLSVDLDHNGTLETALATSGDALLASHHATDKDQKAVGVVSPEAAAQFRALVKTAMSDRAEPLVINGQKFFDVANRIYKDNAENLTKAALDVVAQVDAIAAKAPAATPAMPSQDASPRR